MYRFPIHFLVAKRKQPDFNFSLQFFRLYFEAFFFFLILVKCVVSQTAMAPSQASVHLSSEVEGAEHHA